MVWTSIGLYIGLKMYTCVFHHVYWQFYVIIDILLVERKKNILKWQFYILSEGLLNCNSNAQMSLWWNSHKFNFGFIYNKPLDTPHHYYFVKCAILEYLFSFPQNNFIFTLEIASMEDTSAMYS